MSNSDDNYIGVLLEDIRDQNKAVLEAVGDIQKQVAELPTMKEDIKELKDDMKIIKAAVTDQGKPGFRLRRPGKQLNDHEHRIGDLEAAH